MLSLVPYLVVQQVFESDSATFVEWEDTARAARAFPRHAYLLMASIAAALVAFVLLYPCAIACLLYPLPPCASADSASAPRSIVAVAPDAIWLSVAMAAAHPHIDTLSPDHSRAWFPYPQSALDSVAAFAAHDHLPDKVDYKAIAEAAVDEEEVLAAPPLDALDRIASLDSLADLMASVVAAVVAFLRSARTLSITKTSCDYVKNSPLTFTIAGIALFVKHTITYRFWLVASKRYLSFAPHGCLHVRKASLLP